MYYRFSRTEEELNMEKQIIINILEQAVEAYSSDIPKLNYFDMEEFVSWSRMKRVYKELLEKCKKSDNPVGCIEYYNSKAMSDAQASDKHKDMFMEMYYITEDLLQIVAEELWLGIESDYYI